VIADSGNVAGVSACSVSRASSRAARRGS
jgi:hypothetical protein